VLCAGLADLARYALADRDRLKLSAGSGVPVPPYHAVVADVAANGSPSRPARSYRVR